MNKIIRFLITGLVFVTPLFFLPITSNFYGFNKNFLLLAGVGLAYCLWAVKIISTKKISLKITSLTIIVGLFVLSQILSLILTSPNKTEALLSPGSTGTIIILALFYFLLVNFANQAVAMAVIFSAALLSLMSIGQFFQPQLLPFTWAHSQAWTPAGTTLALISWLAIALALISPMIWHQRQQLTILISYGLLAAIIFAGLSLNGWQVLRQLKNGPLFLPYTTAWQVAIEAFKNQPLLGVGPANFITAFNRFRPASFNQFSFWASRFNTSSSYLLELLTISGGLGLATFLWLALKGLKSGQVYRLAMAVSLLILLALPPSLLSLMLFFVLLALAARATAKRQTIVLPDYLEMAVAGLIILTVSISFYFGGRAYLAETHFYRSLTALAQNRGLDVYNEQIKAIELNPKAANYHLVYSQTNLALAQSLSQKENISDQDRKQIVQLVQQAIREAKIATQLNPQSSEAWENLSQIYRRLINSAQGAENWAITALQEAIRTNPVNPRLRLDLGGLFYSLKNFEAASRQFEAAVQLKPDYANAYYNLAVNYRDQGKYPLAYQAMQQVMSLIPFDSEDYKKAQAELKELEKRLPQPTPTPTPAAESAETTTLTEPEPLPSPVTEEPIELSEEEATPPSQLSPQP